MAELTRRRLLGGVGLPLAVGLLAACAPAPSAPATSAPATGATAAPAATSAPASAATAAAPTTKTKAILGFYQEPTSLDPTADATASIATCLRDNVYEGLVRLDATGRLLPSLAKSWDVSPDGRNVTFHLASGVTWHDGSPFTAQDVKFAWERAMDPNTSPVNPHRDYWAPVETIETPDDATVKVTLTTYSDNWLFHMGAGSACIVSSKSVATNATNPVGTGPFKFGTWNRGASLTLTRNDAYWGTKAKLTDVEYRFINDPDAMNNALKAGDIDAIVQVNGPEQVVQFQQDPSFTVLKGAPAGKVMVSVNETSGPLADKRVRQALYAAIDRQAWIDGVWSGYAVPIGSHATPNDGEPYYADMTSVNTYDPAKAKALLAAAGVSNLTLRLAQIVGFSYAVRGTDILTSQLQAVGVTLNVQPMDFPRWLQTVFQNAQDYDLTIINHVEERDIGNYGNPKYYWHYDNAQVADWLKQADAAPEAATRKDLYTKIQQQLADDAANLWVYAPNQLAVLKRNFQGYQVQGISPSLYLGDASFG
jgi:peptide/nickel transport system substrate-binding protein